MKAATRQLWQRQDRHRGDRQRLFGAVAGAMAARSVLYPGSFVDIAPSFVFDSVVYVDLDRRAAAFFADRTGVNEIIAAHRDTARPADWDFVHADYSGELRLPDAGFDLLVSLYAGFVSVACTRYLRPGGVLLASPSHGDVAMAALDERYELSGVVRSRSGDYSVTTHNLEGYLVPRRQTELTADMVRRTGRGITYTKSPFAYLFRRLA